MKTWRRGGIVLALGAACWSGAFAQQASAPATGSGTAQADDGASTEPDQPVQAQAERLKKNQGAAIDEAWQMLKSAGDASKPLEHVGLLAALGTMGGYKEADAIIAASMKDSDLDVRLAAVTAAGSTKDRSLLPALREALNDKTPEVVMTAAAALWKLGDHSGEDVLQGVLSGQVKGRSGALKSGLHTMTHDMHDPSMLWMMGAEEGGGMIFGPVGMAISAVRFARPGASPNSPRVIAAGLLAESSSMETEKIFIASAKDKDPFVRQASMRALGRFHGTAVTDALLDGFDDPKPSVRYMAAASYIRAVSPGKGIAHHAAKHD